MAKIPEQPNLFKRRLSSKDYYEAISSAEFRDGRSYDSRWIRTEANPPKDVSTAFGPVQITLLKALDYARRGLLSEKAVSAVNQMIPMYNKFKAKDSKGGPYGYGGSGNFRAELKPLYESLAQEMIAHDMNSGNKIKGVERWRGVKASQDKKYFGTFVKTMLDKVDQNYIGPKHL